MQKSLGMFDVTNLTIGSIIGADIYIASAITAGIIGPFALAAWIVAGGMALVLALVFAYCSRHLPQVGGPFAYTSNAFNPFLGFLTGWSLWLAELIALPVFAIAFANYLGYFIHLSFLENLLVKAAFLAALTAVNVAGVKAAGILNDVLTLLKLAPLAALAIFGMAFLAAHPEALRANLTPLAPLGLGGFKTALVLVFWAYVGFELTTIPASEVRDPARVIPRAIVTGVLVIILFYLTTNFVVYGLINWRDLAQTATPLALAGAALFGGAGAAIMALGALVSVSGSDESDMLATARLSYAMALAGLFPSVFGKLHPRFGTPYMALIVQGFLAFGLSIYSGLSGLISFSVFNLSFAFLMTCLALLVFQRRSGRFAPGQVALALTGGAICLFLLYSTSWLDKAAGSALLALGTIFYLTLPRQAQPMAHFRYVERHRLLARALERERRFLGALLRLGHRIGGAAAGKPRR